MSGKLFHILILVCAGMLELPSRTESTLDTDKILIFMALSDEAPPPTSSDEIPRVVGEESDYDDAVLLLSSGEVDWIPMESCSGPSISYRSFSSFSGVCVGSATSDGIVTGVRGAVFEL